MFPPSDTGEDAADLMPPRYRYPLAGGIVLLLLLIISAGLTFGGEAKRFVEVGLQSIPFIPLALLGILGLHYEGVRIASYLYALILQALIALMTLAFATMGLSKGPLQGMSLNLRPDGALLLILLVLLLGIGFLACSSVLLRPVRTWLAHWVPIDPDNSTHTIALWIVLFSTLSAWLQLAILGGQPPLLTAITAGAISQDDLGERSALGQHVDLLYGLTWMIPLVLFSAGWPLKRSLGATLQRLGLVVPSWKQVLFALFAALGLVIIMLVAGQGIQTIWEQLGWRTTDSAAFERLLGATISPIGALVIGFTAGLGEELAVRGLLQTRLGLLLSNLAFTAMHAYQYGLDALFIVFMLGLMLGIVRQQSNTTTGAIVHGVYNALLVLGSVWAQNH